jgi:hypothetical protein
MLHCEKYSDRAVIRSAATEKISEHNRHGRSAIHSEPAVGALNSRSSGVMNQQRRIAPFTAVLPNPQSILPVGQPGGIEVDTQDGRTIGPHSRISRRDQYRFRVAASTDLKVICARLASQRERQQQMDDAARENEWRWMSHGRFCSAKDGTILQVKGC